MKADDAVRGGLALAFDTVEGVTDIVEGMHRNIAAPFFLATPSGRARGISGFVYACVRGVTGALRGVVGSTVAPRVDQCPSQREPWLAALNGVIGDHLERSANPLAIPMRLRVDGCALAVEREALRAALPDAGDHILVLVHGLCMNDLQWTRTLDDGSTHDHGRALAESLDCTPLWLHYNTGRHVAANGRDFAATLAQLYEQWPLPLRRITLVGHSMGGLVIRSALHGAGEDGAEWLSKVARAAYIGTPHHGTALERAGNKLQALIAWSRYSAPLADLGALRSAGITDLRHGNVVDADSERFAHHQDRRRPTPLAPGIGHFAIAGTLSTRTDDLVTDLLGDGLVHPASATGHHHDEERALGFATGSTRVFPSTGHMALLSSHEVYEQLAHWLG